MAIGRPTEPLNVTPEEKEKLAVLARRPKSAQALTMRARIVLVCSEGLSHGAAAKKLQITGATVCKWRERFRVNRLEGLLDKAGNVGRSAVFQTKQHGATVIAGVLKRQVEEALTTGADRVIAFDDESTESLEPLDAIADTIGGPLVDSLLQRVKKGGIFASVLAPPSTAGAYPVVRVEVMQVRPQPAALLIMAAAVRTGKLTIPLGQRFALQDTAKAHEAAEKHSAGKIVLLA